MGIWATGDQDSLLVLVRIYFLWPAVKSKYCISSAVLCHAAVSSGLGCSSCLTATNILLVYLPAALPVQPVKMGGFCLAVMKRKSILL